MLDRVAGGKRGYWLAGIVILSGCLVLSVSALRRTYKGEVFDQYELGNEGMKLRATAFHEKGLFVPVPGAFYTFESQSASEHAWREIVTFRHDDAIPITRHQMQTLDTGIAYFYIGWLYGVTTDRGRTWSIWDAARDLQGWKPVNYRLIEKVELGRDGGGRMLLRAGQLPYRELVTLDFGRTWRARAS